MRYKILGDARIEWVESTDITIKSAYIMQEAIAEKEWSESYPSHTRIGSFCFLCDGDCIYNDEGEVRILHGSKI